MDYASLLEGDDFELVGKCIFYYLGLMGFVWGILIIKVIITVPQTNPRPCLCRLDLLTATLSILKRDEFKLVGKCIQGYIKEF